jgi:hypothetical protein
LIFPLIIFYRYKSKLLINDLRYLIVLLPICVFIFKNLLGTGCVIYPLASTCIEYISWSNFTGAKELSLSAEIFNKSWYSYSGDLSEENYIKNFSWLNTWFERGKVEILELFLTTMLVASIAFVLYDLKSKKIYSTNVYFKDLKIILLSIIILSTILFFFKNPVIRMNHFTIISLMILIISLFFRFDISKHKRNFITIVIAIGLIFNLSKNIKRIHGIDFLNDPYEMISEKIEIQKKKNLSDFTYYIGWYGDAPISSYEINDKKFKKVLIFDILY